MAARANCRTPNSPVCCAAQLSPRAYANMDLFVFPSHTDTFGNVVLEALACGVPAIVTPGRRPQVTSCATG